MESTVSEADNQMAKALATLQGRIGDSTPPTDWLEITQDRINDFADVTMDHQWIHIDVARANDGPFGQPIAHGHLTLSIIALDGRKLAINYGFDKVRFPSPVPVGALIRSISTLKRAEIKGGMIEVMNEVVVEVQGQEKPAVVAESLGRLVF